MLSTIKEHRAESAFPNIFIALRNYLTLPVSNCTGERSFSRSPLDNGSSTSVKLNDSKHRI